MSDANDEVPVTEQALYWGYGAMSFSNERIIAELRRSGAEEELVSELEDLDQQIDAILREGGASRDACPAQLRFNELVDRSRTGSTDG